MRVFFFICFTHTVSFYDVILKFEPHAEKRSKRLNSSYYCECLLTFCKSTAVESKPFSSWSCVRFVFYRLNSKSEVNAYIKCGATDYIALRCVFHNKPLQSAITDTHTERTQLYFHSSDPVLQNYPLSQPWNIIFNKRWKWHWEHFKRRERHLKMLLRVSAIIFQLFTVIIIEKCVLNILQLNWNQRLGN